MSGWACYGLRFVGIDGAAHYMYPATDEPVVTVHQEPGFDGRRDAEELTGDAARLHLSDGTGLAVLDRAAGTVTLRVSRPYPDEALLHPMLSSTAAVFNRWLGRDSFHAGVFLNDERAWVVTGGKGDGKSTTLGYLAGHGVPVLADDLAVIERGRVYPGPGFIDLRTEAASAIDGPTRDLGQLGARARTRLDLPGSTSAGSYPLAGFIQLGWADELALVPVPVPERLALLFGNSAVQRAPLDPASYLRYAALPYYRLTRPRSLAQLPAVQSLLRSSLSR